ncbi:MAG: SigB/SigF/SigG family RNA polymerase sigma factor [Gordonia sp. (in: high G+C Gram-positive bacteria)]|uniref:SigB/SigF/SigG family RNA polymerase sigma factor n=1 Tax=Gordonia sp. (in: high G+C Gram-positive bacteria) TaxID=84139 RepID=UPI003BB507C4
MNTDRYDEAKELLTRQTQNRPGEPEYERLRGRVILLCLPLAEHIARRFSGRGEPYDDLLQVARVGLIHAIDRFNPTAGSELLSFAVPTVMGEVRRYFRDRSPVIRIPRRSRELQARVRAVHEELAQRFLREPTVPEIAEQLGVTAADVRKAVDDCAAGAAVSLDEGRPGDDEGPARIDRMGSEDPGFGHVENLLELEPALQVLPVRERRILSLRYADMKSQSEIAAEVGISQMHVSRLLRRSLADLRQVLLAPAA